MKTTSAVNFSEDLYISNSQIFTYQNCSLKYFYHYVEKREMESVDVSLPFGSAVHAALEYYYRSYMVRGERPSFEDMIACFEDYFDLDIENSESTSFSKAMYSRDSAIETGRQMLNKFYNENDMTGFDVVAVELPLTAPLSGLDGSLSDIRLAGIIDLLLRDGNGDMLIVDNKTAAKSMSQTAADDSNQMTAYSYLLSVNDYIPDDRPVDCRFDVFLKQKNPGFQQVHTIRGDNDRRRFMKLANTVLTAIEARIFMPNRSWMCGGCQFATICEEW